MDCSEQSGVKVSKPMSRRKVEPLRKLSVAEREDLERIGRERKAPVEWVQRARIILAVSKGKQYRQAAQAVGRRDVASVSRLVKRFNEEGVAALDSRHGGGPVVKYGSAERERILREVQRQPTCAQAGTAHWSLKSLKQALRTASDGLPEVSEDTLRKVLLEGGYSWQQSRSWCQTGQASRIRKQGTVPITDPNTEVKKKRLNTPISWVRRRV